MSGRRGLTGIPGMWYFSPGRCVLRIVLRFAGRDVPHSRSLQRTWRRPPDGLVPMLNLPNVLTIFRIFLVPFLVVVLLTKFEGKEILGVIIFLVAAATDVLDGYLARRRKQVTDLGKLLDPVADKLLISAALISLVEQGVAPAWMVVVIVGREFAVGGLRSVAIQRGITIPASVWGKFKMGSQVLAVVLLILGPKLPAVRLAGGKEIGSGEAVLWLVVVLAVASGVDYFLKFYRRLGFARGPAH